MITGYVHSTESFGTVDGPGIRFVVFMQGCPMRCLYCHNPDTWEISRGTEVTADELITQLLKNKSFYASGGITVSGGEPMLQIEFITDLFKKAKENNIHTCIDTSGITFRDSYEYINKLDNLLMYTDLVMLDIKHIDNEKHIKLTGHSNKAILSFAKYLEKKSIPVWIRHVVVEGITDTKEDLINLGKMIGTLKNVKALDVIPYHTMGVNKYKELGLGYPLDGVPDLSVQDAALAKQYIIEGIKKVR